MESSEVLGYYKEEPEIQTRPEFPLYLNFNDLIKLKRTNPGVGSRFNQCQTNGNNENTHMKNIILRNKMWENPIWQHR